MVCFGCVDVVVIVIHVCGLWLNAEEGVNGVCLVLV